MSRHSASIFFVEKIFVTNSHSTSVYYYIDPIILHLKEKKQDEKKIIAILIVVALPHRRAHRYPNHGLMRLPLI